MPRKKTEELEAEGTIAETSQDESLETSTVETAADAGAETASEDKAQSEPETDEKAADEGSLIGSVFETVSAAVTGVASAVAGGVSAVVAAVTPDSSTTNGDQTHHSKRAEKIGIVKSDKMTKTVTVRVDRQVKHPIYRKYIKRRKNFMAHDELGSGVGDKVRIIETRPLSARKRWRVVEIIQKAVK